MDILYMLESNGHKIKNMGGLLMNSLYKHHYFGEFDKMRQVSTEYRSDNLLQRSKENVCRVLRTNMRCTTHRSFESLYYIDHVDFEAVVLTDVLNIWCLRSIKKIIQNGKLVKLKVVGCVNDNILQDCNFPQLESLKLEKTNISDTGLEYLFQHNSLSHLKNLSLKGCEKITDKGLSNFFKNLKIRNTPDTLNTLNLSQGHRIVPQPMWMRMKFGNETLETLSEISSLECLNLNASGSFTNEGLKPLQKLTNLRVLNLGGFHRLNDDGIRILSTFSNITHLLISASDIKKCVLEQLKVLRKLKHLELGVCREFQEQELCKLITSIPKLSGLGLNSNNHLTNRFFVTLHEKTNLTFLDISFCRTVDDNILESLYKMSSLKHLKLDYCTGIKNKENQFRKLKELESLGLVGLKFEYHTEIHFPSTLKYLNLKSVSPIPNLDFMESLPQLTTLGLDISELKKEKLAETKPNIKVYNTNWVQMPPMKVYESLPDFF
jgi:hypothetical protein